MKNFKEYVNNYFNYYLELEEEFLNSRKYVEFNKKNYKTFSIEYIKLFQAICSEIDVVGKVLAQLINKKFKPDRKTNIHKWWMEVQDNECINSKNWDGIKNSKAKVGLIDAILHNMLIDEDFQPWGKYRLKNGVDKNGNPRVLLVDTYSTPSWWTAYNSVKHDRTGTNKKGDVINYEKANLGNVFSAIAALYLLEIAILECVGTSDQIDDILNKGKLFSKNDHRLTITNFL